MWRLRNGDGRDWSAAVAAFAIVVQVLLFGLTGDYAASAAMMAGGSMAHSPPASGLVTAGAADHHAPADPCRPCCPDGCLPGPGGLAAAMLPSPPMAQPQAAPLSLGALAALTLSLKPFGGGIATARGPPRAT